MKLGDIELTEWQVFKLEVIISVLFGVSIALSLIGLFAILNIL